MDRRLRRMDAPALPGGGTVVRRPDAPPAPARADGRCAACRPGSALLFPGCDSVHTAWMRMAIDVVFLDADGRVLAVRRGCARGGWRAAAARRRCWSARRARADAAAQRAVLPRGDAGLTRKIGFLPLLNTPVAGATK